MCRITSYKGYEREVVIPETAGKRTISDVAASTFDWESAHISIANRKHREHIRSIEYPGSVREVKGYYDLSGTCGRPGPELARIVLNGGTTSIGSRAFRGAPALREVMLPDTLRDIGWGAFHDCEQLHHVDLPEGLLYIGEDAFRGSGLDVVYIPASVQEISADAFAHCL